MKILWYLKVGSSSYYIWTMLCAEMIRLNDGLPLDVETEEDVRRWAIDNKFTHVKKCSSELYVDITK